MALATLSATLSAALSLSFAPPSAAAPESHARGAFDEGLEAVAAGEFEQAVVSFERAHELRPHPVTAYNLALALELAGRLPEAWGLFHVVIEIVESDRERRQIRRRMQRIEEKIVLLEIHASPGTQVCVDGREFDGEAAHDPLALESGPHLLLVDGRELPLDLRPGDRRALVLGESESENEHARAVHKRGPLMPAMLGLSVGSGALALGLGVGALASPDPQMRTGLGAGATVAAGAALAGGIVAILLESRAIRDPSPPRRPRPCLGNPTFDARVDRRVGPTIERPAEFAATPDLRELYERGEALPGIELAALRPGATR